jgi:hypothetical protein
LDIPISSSAVATSTALLPLSLPTLSAPARLPRVSSAVAQPPSQASPTDFSIPSSPPSSVVWVCSYNSKGAEAPSQEERRLTMEQVLTPSSSSASLAWLRIARSVRGIATSMRRADTARSRPGKDEISGHAQQSDESSVTGPDAEGLGLEPSWRMESVIGRPDLGGEG